MNYKEQSFYAKTKQYDFYLDILEPRTVVESPDDKEYVIEPKYHLRPELLAYEIYGDVNYFWVFCVRNPDLIIDPIEDFVAGKIIKIPSVENIN